jgi:negative regulator of sigma E activity
MKYPLTTIKNFLYMTCLLLFLCTFSCAEDIDGRTVLKNMLESEGKVAFIARQATTIKGKTSITSEQIVYRAGFKGMRIEYVQPPALKGEVIVDDGEVYMHLIPRERILRSGPSRLKMLQMRTSEASKGFRRNLLSVNLIGKDHVAGRDAYIIEVKSNRPGRHPTRKFWVDTAKWIKLKTQDIAPDGTLLSMSYYKEIDFVDQIDERKFHLDIPPGVHVVRQPQWKTVPLDKVKKYAGFKVLEPTYLPKGFRAVGASLIPFRHGKMVVVRYTDGVSSFSLFQTPSHMLDRKFLARLHEGPVKPREGIYSWKADGLNLTIVGQISMDEIRKIAASIK